MNELNKTIKEIEDQISKEQRAVAILISDEQCRAALALKDIVRKATEVGELKHTLHALTQLRAGTVQGGK